MNIPSIAKLQKSNTMQACYSLLATLQYPPATAPMSYCATQPTTKNYRNSSMRSGSRQRAGKEVSRTAYYATTAVLSFVAVWLVSLSRQASAHGLLPPPQSCGQTVHGFGPSAAVTTDGWGEAGSWLSPLYSSRFGVPGLSLLWVTLFTVAVLVMTSETCCGVASGLLLK